jgi:hypothetical protein
MNKDELEELKRVGEFRRNLVREGRYEEALSSLEQCLQRHKENRRQFGLHQERALLQLYFGHPREARADFDAVELLQEACFHTKPGRLQSDGPYSFIGVTYWIEERRELALAFWRYTTSLLLKGRVAYSHIGGGIESGLLLWFGAVHEHSDGDLALVRELFQKRLASTFWSHNLNSWPGPIVRFFLEHVSESELLGEVRDAQDRCNAHFALAIRAREKRRYAAYKKHMQVAAEYDDPVRTRLYAPLPYFLARHEVEN